MAEVFVFGNGGREDALRQAMEASEEVSYVETGTDLSVLSDYAYHEKPLVIIGPEQPLVDGLADELRADGYPVFGVGKRAARYESKKSFAVQMMWQAGVLYPNTYFTDRKGEAFEFVESNDPESYVIKADGLAGGKGVVLPDTKQEAFETVHDMMSGRILDGAGKTVNFQERLHGPEVSAMVVVGDNDEFTILPIAQDHKRLRDGDEGPNTGGMGAYAPVPDSILGAEQYDALYDSVHKTLTGMRAYGTPFERGLLYAGYMLAEENDGAPTVIEYNVRFGDPETQVILPLLQSAGVDTYSLLRSAAEGDLEIPPAMSGLGHAALTVCLAAEGYPLAPVKGQPVYGTKNSYPDVIIQQAGVQDGLTAGGRVLYVTGTGKTVDQAAAAAYAAIDTDRAGQDSGKVGFEGMQYRTDIGYQAR